MSDNSPPPPPPRPPWEHGGSPSFPPYGAPPQGTPGRHQPAAPQPEKKQRSTWWPLYLFLGSLLAVGLCCGGLAVGLVYLGSQSPDTKVLQGQQVPAKHMQRINALGLLSPGEEVLFFYSDALVNVDEGVYLLTSKGIVLYSKTWSPPKIVLPYEDIADATLIRDTSFFTDSTIIVEGDDGQYCTFPVSSEVDGDLRFYNTLRKNAGLPEE